MPVIVSCFKCRRKLRIHDHLIGRKARCPACKSIFMTEGDEPPDPPAPDKPVIHVAPFGSAPPVRRASPNEGILEGILRERPEEPPEPEYPRPVRLRRPRRVYPGNWEKVRTGLTIILMSVIVLCLTVLVACAGGFAVGYWGPRANQAANPGQIQAAPIALIVVIFLMRLTSSVLSLIGNIFCLAAPEKYGAKTLATVVLILAALAFAFDFMSVELPIIGLVALIISFIKFFFFMAFLSALAGCLNRRDLRDTVATTATLAGSTIVMWITTLIVTIIGIANGFIDPKQRDNPGALVYFVGFFSCIVAILGVCFLVWYMRTLEQARDEIDSYLRGS